MHLPALCEPSEALNRCEIWLCWDVKVHDDEDNYHLLCDKRQGFDDSTQEMLNDLKCLGKDVYTQF